MPIQTQKFTDLKSILKMLGQSSLKLDEIEQAIKQLKTTLQSNVDSKVFNQHLNTLQDLKLIQNLIEINHTYQYHLDYINQNAKLIDDHYDQFEPEYWPFLKNLYLNLIVKTPSQLQLTQIKYLYQFNATIAIRTFLLELVQKNLKKPTNETQIKNQQALNEYLQQYQKLNRKHDHNFEYYQTQNRLRDLAILFHNGLFSKNEAKRIYHIYRSQNFNRIKRQPWLYFNNINPHYTDVYLKANSNRKPGLNRLTQLNHMRYLQKKAILKWWLNVNNESTKDQAKILKLLCQKNLITNKQYALSYNHLHQTDIKAHKNPYYIYNHNLDGYYENENIEFVIPIFKHFAIKKTFSKSL